MRNDFQSTLKLVVKVVISFTFITIGLVFLDSGNSAKETLGAGFLGTVLGYWVK